MLFDPHDSEELAMGIRGMVDDLELRQGYVEKGLRRAKQFTWEKCARETLQLFEEVVQG